MFLAKMQGKKMDTAMWFVQNDVKNNYVFTNDNTNKFLHN